MALTFEWQFELVLESIISYMRLSQKIASISHTPKNPTNQQNPQS